MSCAQVSDWYLRRRIAVVDLASPTWREAQAELVPPGYSPNECMRRLVAAGRLRHVARGLYVVVDPVRETSTLAIASALFADVPHYVTTDAALVFHGLIDQPLTTITVVVPHSRRPIDIGGTTVRSVTLSPERLGSADGYATSVDGFLIRVATREQAVIDAVAEPHWMVHVDLLPEILSAFSKEELEQVSSRALARSTAAGQRLGYLLEEAGREPPKTLARLKPLRSIRLRPAQRRRGPYSTRWRVYG